MYRDLPYTHCLDTCIASSIINFPYESGTFIKDDEWISTYHNLPKFKCILEFFLSVVCSMDLDGLDFLTPEVILFLDLKFTIIFPTVIQWQRMEIFQIALEGTNEEINIYWLCPNKSIWLNSLIVYITWYIIYSEKNVVGLYWIVIPAPI